MLLTTSATADLTVKGITVEAGQVQITAKETGNHTHYELQTSPDLISAWAIVPGANIQISGNLVTATTPFLDDGSRFYRIRGFMEVVGTLDDRDGDGLGNNFETFTHGTNPDLFDSDGDGWSDGKEFAFGTNPNDIHDFPNQSDLPAIAFAESLSSALEGNGPHTVTLQFSSPYSGTVLYSVNARSTASAPTDFQTLSGSVAVSGSSAVISINPVNDSEISGERLIVLDLVAPPNGAGYRRGGRASHVICLGDNDAYYSGALQDGIAERNFRVRVLRESGATSVTFVAGASDGTTAPAGIAGSQSEGIIPIAPQSAWPGTGIIDSPSHFRAISPPLPTGATGLFTSTANLQRTLTLDASEASLITPDRIIGFYTDSVSSADPGKIYLDRTTSGRFVLIKDLPDSPDFDSEFHP